MGDSSSEQQPPGESAGKAAKAAGKRGTSEEAKPASAKGAGKAGTSGETKPAPPKGAGKAGTSGEAKPASAKAPGKRRAAGSAKPGAAKGAGKAGTSGEAKPASAKATGKRGAAGSVKRVTTQTGAKRAASSKSRKKQADRETGTPSPVARQAPEGGIPGGATGPKDTEAQTEQGEGESSPAAGYAQKHLEAIEPLADQLREPSSFRSWVTQNIESQPSLGWEKKLLAKWANRKKK